jgi:uncharacterized membrane protein YozB (DUF420 family)
MSASLAQTLDLGIQLGVLVMITAGFLFFRRKKYLWHAQILTMAFFMIVTSFLLVMVQSLSVTYATFLDQQTVVFDTVSMAHIPFGIAGLILGGFLVGRWARNNFSLRDMKAPRLMRATLSLWVINIVLGAVIYITMPS